MNFCLRRISVKCDFGESFGCGIVFVTSCQLQRRSRQNRTLAKKRSFCNKILVDHSNSQLPRGPHAEAIVLSAAAVDADDVSAAVAAADDDVVVALLVLGARLSSFGLSFFNENENNFFVIEI